MQQDTGEDGTIIDFFIQPAQQQRRHAGEQEHQRMIPQTHLQPGQQISCVMHQAEQRRLQENALYGPQLMAKQFA